MKTLLFIGLIISLIVYGIKILSYIYTSILWVFFPNNEIFKKQLEMLKNISPNYTKFKYIFGGLEHAIIFASLLASILIIF